MTVGGATAVVVGAGYSGQARLYERIAELGARVVIVDEPGHWSEELVADGIAESWVGAPVTGDPDCDAQRCWMHSAEAASTRTVCSPFGRTACWSRHALRRR